MRQIKNLGRRQGIIYACIQQHGETKYEQILDRVIAVDPTTKTQPLAWLKRETKKAIQGMIADGWIKPISTGVYVLHGLPLESGAGKAPRITPKRTFD